MTNKARDFARFSGDCPRESILIADDEKFIRDGLKVTLQASGFDVKVARNGEECLVRFLEERPSLVLLDVMMPRKNGFEACEEIRRYDSEVPIVFLTAKDATEDEVHGLSIGADDFVSKSAETAVLLARIRRLLSRAADLEPVQEVELSIGKVKINLRSGAVSEGKRTARLTRTQADILRLLLNAPNHLLSKEEMLSGLRGAGYACTDGAVYTHIYNLRERLGSAAGCIDCQSGIGYRLIL